MKTTNRTYRTGSRLRWILAAMMVVALASPLANLTALADSRDLVWVDPQIQREKPTEVAVLPAVAFIDDPQAVQVVEIYGSLLLAETGHVVQPASRVRQALMGVGERPNNPLYERLARQVRSEGTIDASLASTLTHLTGAPMLLSLRIDRWEVVDNRAQVELTAALVDSTGRVLWKINGRAGHGGGGPSRFATLDLPRTALVEGAGSGGAGADPQHARLFGELAVLRLDPGRRGDEERALRILMNRWILLIPHGAGDPDSPSLPYADATARSGH